jgi:hypothetical protein
MRPHFGETRADAGGVDTAYPRGARWRKTPTLELSEPWTCVDYHSSHRRLHMRVPLTARATKIRPHFGEFQRRGSSPPVLATRRPIAKARASASARISPNRGHWDYHSSLRRLHLRGNYESRQGWKCVHTSERPERTPVALLVRRNKIALPRAPVHPNRYNCRLCLIRMVKYSSSPRS